MPNSSFSFDLNHSLFHKQDLSKGIQQFQYNDGFCKVGIHSGFIGNFSVFIKGIGGKGDDRDTGEGRIFESTDFSGGSITIHNRHLQNL